MSTKLENLVNALQQVLGERIKSLGTDLGEVTVALDSTDYPMAMQALQIGRAHV